MLLWAMARTPPQQCQRTHYLATGTSTGDEFGLYRIDMPANGTGPSTVPAGWVRIGQGRCSSADQFRCSGLWLPVRIPSSSTASPKCVGYFDHFDD